MGKYSLKRTEGEAGLKLFEGNKLIAHYDPLRLLIWAWQTNHPAFSFLCEEFWNIRVTPEIMRKTRDAWENENKIAKDKDGILKTMPSPKDFLANM